jgi:alpha-galactosidase
MVMVKDIADGSKAVGLFNFPGDKNSPADYFTWDQQGDGSRKIKLTASELGLKGNFKVRDVWRQKNLGEFKNSFETKIPYHGVVFIKISPETKK